ncbi:MAG TPA: hypothetical protein VMZ50_09190 [Phycisphaerae bacterium]|nr:hypothetical protein [Phycisphaerae bacterium]
MRSRAGRAALIGVALVAIAAAGILSTCWPARGAVALTGSTSAKAGTGGTTAGTFVKLEAAGTIITATACTDKVVGIAEKTASANAMTHYAPVGTQATVTSGEAIAVGDLLTAGTSGYAYVLDADDASTQRVAAIALTAADDAAEDVTVIILPSVAEQRLALGGAVTISGSNTFTTGTGTVQINGDANVAADKDLTCGSGTGVFDFSGASGTFKTSTGDHTLAGNVAISGSKTLTTGSGAVTLAGDTTVSGSKTFTTGTGTVQINGDANIAADKDLTCGSGTGVFDFSAASGTFKTSTGDHTLAGNVTISGSKTLTTGSGTVQINGDANWAADKDIKCATGTSEFDFSGGSGTFKTSTGAHTIAGDVTISGTKTLTTGTGTFQLNGDANVAAGKDISLAAGAGYIELNGTTSGGIKLDPIDVGTATTTLQNSNGAAGTLTLPLGTDTLVARATTDTLTNKTIDGDDNTVSDVDANSWAVMKGGTNVYKTQTFSIIFTPNAAGNYDWTVPTGKKVRVLRAYAHKTVAAGAHANDELTITDGTNALWAKMELVAASDGDYMTFTTLDDGHHEIAAAGTLRCVALEDAAGGCDAIVVVECCWVTP